MLNGNQSPVLMKLRYQDHPTVCSIKTRIKKVNEPISSSTLASCDQTINLNLSATQKVDIPIPNLTKDNKYTVHSHIATLTTHCQSCLLQSYEI